MNKGILLIDGSRNVVLIHPDEMSYITDLFREETRRYGESVLRRVKKHKNNKELDITVHKYIKAQYDDEEVDNESLS